MKLVTAFLALLLSGGFAQTSTAPLVVQGEGCFMVAFLEFSPDGGELARGCRFGPIEMFDTASYKKARTFLPEIDHTPELTGFDYSPDGTTIATARGHSGAVIWKAADPGRPVPPDGKPLRPFFGVDEVYALEKPLHVLEPSGSRDEFASVLSIKYRYLDITAGTCGEREREQSTFCRSNFSRRPVLRGWRRKRRTALPQPGGQLRTANIALTRSNTPANRSRVFA